MIGAPASGRATGSFGSSNRVSTSARQPRWRRSTWKHAAPPRMDGVECDMLVRARVRTLEKEAVEDVRGRGRKFLGEKRVLRQDPYDSPTTWEKRRGRNPTFASRDKWARIEAAQRNRGWLSEYADALEALREGVRDAVFPTGTWLMVRRYGCRCASALA